MKMIRTADDAYIRAETILRLYIEPGKKNEYRVMADTLYRNRADCLGTFGDMERAKAYLLEQIERLQGGD